MRRHAVFIAVLVLLAGCEAREAVAPDAARPSPGRTDARGRKPGFPPPPSDSICICLPGDPVPVDSAFELP